MSIAAPEPVHVACLCAAWCRLCDAYAEVFMTATHALRATHPQMLLHWIDIEDEADLVGEFDVETFPTLVVADGTAVRFAGTLTPQAETLHRVLRAALQARPDDMPAQAPEIEAFATRLRKRPPDHSGYAK